MAPKSKSKKPRKMKTSPVVDSLSTEDMYKVELEEHIVRLREELELAREKKSLIQLDRNNTQESLEKCREEVEQAKDKLRQAHQEREETQQRYQVEISIYKLKLKHILSEQHNTVSELKMEAATSASLIQNQHTESELELHSNMLQSDAREKTLYQKKCIKEIKLKHQEALLTLTNNYDKKFRELEVKFNEGMQATIEVEEQMQRLEINKLDDRMNARVVALVEDHACALRRAEEYYSSIQKKVLEDEMMLKEEVAETQKQLKQMNKQLSVAQRENKRLLESLHEAEQKLPEFQQQVHECNRTKANIVKSGARVKATEKELWDLTIEHELLLQTSEKVQKERDELQRKQMNVMLEVQQRNGLKQLLLERKLAALTQTVETKEAQLCATLSTATASDTAGSSSANKLKETLESKHVTIAALDEDLAREHQEYNQLLQTCTDRLKALSVSLHDFPFRPMKQTLRVNTTSYTSA
ncbi:dynein regulatory complex subunit 4-like [Paralichthys olivaceus]|uniref:dynein regulatory complex subunit 4-like n=1 Tax=Paralichthys olivaceus TaxID=8255 RepID=UPI00375274B0